MGFNASLLTNVALAIEIPLFAQLAAKFTTLDVSLIAFLLTFFWLLPQKTNGAKYAIFVLLIPYSLGIFAAIYQRNLAFTFHLVLEVLILGNREYASANALGSFSTFYCPISIIGYALGKRMELINDLARYGLWRFEAVRLSTDALLRVLTLIDLAAELFYRITFGLKSRYIDISNWRGKMSKMNLWAPGFLRSILLAGLARNDYLMATGIGIYKIRRDSIEGILWKEIMAVSLLLLTLILLIITR